MSGGRAVFFAADAAYLELAWVAAGSVAVEPGRDFDVWLLVDKAPPGIAPRWNFMTHYMGLGLEAAVQPRILHYANVLKPWRDPEWARLYGRHDTEAFALLFKDSPWPGFVHKGLGAALPWRKRAALRAAQQARHVPEAALAGHVANFTAMVPHLWRNVRAGFAEGAAGYVDLTPEERAAWAALG